MESTSRTEGEPTKRPKLEVDLTTWDGHWFNLVCAAQGQLEGEALQAFNRDMGELLWHSTDSTYNDLFQTIHAHMDLVDTSGAFEAYAPKPPSEQAGGHDAAPQEPPSVPRSDEEAP